MPDSLDGQILELLSEDARRSHRELARALGVSQPTITARVRRLEDAGIIKGYTLRLDEAAFAPGQHGIRVVCHWCDSRTAEPLWARVDGRDHPFCCPTCKSQYLAKYERLSKHL